MIRDWDRRIKAARLNVETAKTDYEKRWAANELNKLNEDFVKNRQIWLEARKAHEARWLRLYKAETNRVNSVLNELDSELLEAKKLAGIV
jgi:hypothetical protein